MFWYILSRARGSAVEALRRKPEGCVLGLGSFEFFVHLILPALGLTQPLTEMSTRTYSWGVKAAGA
jgi:hypothetical protein